MSVSGSPAALPAGAGDPVVLPGDLVDGVWLEAALAGAHPDLVVADVRWYLDGRSGAEAYLGGHIPGAVHLDLDTELSAVPFPGSGRHPLPPPGDLAATLAGHGIGAGTSVVAYDDAGGSIAARLWWMLRTLGLPAAVLDGGLGAWPAAVDTGGGPPQRTVGPVPVPQGWPASAVATTDDVADGAFGVLLDARTAVRHAGAPGSPDARPGHIPRAISAPWTDNLDPATGRMADPTTLRARYGTLGVRPGTDVVASCGSGVTACHDLLAMHLAGISGRLYPPSQSGWSDRSDGSHRPLAIAETSPLTQ